MSGVEPKFEAMLTLTNLRLMEGQRTYISETTQMIRTWTTYSHMKYTNTTLQCNKNYCHSNKCYWAS